MSLTNAERRIAARELAVRMFVNVGMVANMNLDDLTAAIGSIDDTMDALPGALNGAQTIKVNFVQRLPEPFKSRSTDQQKSIALMIWALKEIGIL
jgi:hypothetical protein